MRSLLLPTAVLVLLLTLCLWNGHLLTQRCEEWTAQLQVIDDLAEGGEWDAARSQLERLYGDWQQVQTWLHITVAHDGLNEAEGLFRRAAVLAEEEDSVEFRAHAADLAAALQMLCQTEQLRAENVL